MKNHDNSIFSEKGKVFTRTLFTAAIPVTIQSLLQNSLSFIDTLMIGQLGEIEIAAAGLANQMYFLISVILFGVSSGAAIFTSQFWGSKDEKSFQYTVGVALTCGLSVAIVFAVFSIFFPQVLMHIFVHDFSVVYTGCRYLRWVGISYLFAGTSLILSITLRSSGDMVNPMRATLFSMLFNVLGNYLLIFVANLGVSGAAIATTVSRFLEMLILWILLKRSTINLHLKTCFSYSKSFFKKVSKTAFPVILDDSLWALGMTVYKAVYSRMGIASLAASNVSESVQDLIFVLQIGMGAAISVLIGNEIGKGNEKEAQKMAKWSLLSLIPVIAFASLVMALISPFIPRLFNIDSSVMELTKLSMLAISVTIPFKFINHVLVTGILRSGGDTKFLLFTEVFSIWVVGVPVAYISGLVLGFPLWSVYLCIALEEISKIIILLPRTFSGKWITNLTISR